MRRAYQEIMDRIEMTEEMRNRILQNISGANTTKKQKILRFPAKNALLVAACFALLIGVFSLSYRPTPPVQQMGPVFDAVECASAEELSETLGFEVQEPEKLPFTVTDRTYCALWGELAQIEYSGPEGMVTYRVSQGPEDNSGDYNDYAQTVTEELEDVSVMLKGSDGIYRLALWQKDGISYSISAEPGLTRQQILEMLPKG